MHHSEFPNTLSIQKYCRQNFVALIQRFLSPVMLVDTLQCYITWEKSLTLRKFYNPIFSMHYKSSNTAIKSLRHLFTQFVLLITCYFAQRTTIESTESCKQKFFSQYLHNKETELAARFDHLLRLYSWKPHQLLTYAVMLEDNYWDKFLPVTSISLVLFYQDYCYG